MTPNDTILIRRFKDKSHVDTAHIEEGIFALGYVKGSPQVTGIQLNHHPRGPVREGVVIELSEIHQLPYIQSMDQFYKVLMADWYGGNSPVEQIDEHAFKLAFDFQRTIHKDVDAAREMLRNAYNDCIIRNDRDRGYLAPSPNDN